MIKVDIVNEVSKIADITKVKAEVAVDAGRNPRTGKEVRIPPGRTIRFKPGKDLQNIG
jgi:DNA-binding protein HU-beta